MAEVVISVRCSFSGNEIEFIYDNDNTLEEFILDLQSEGMAWPKGSITTDTTSITIDNEIFYINQLLNLHEWSMPVTLMQLGVLSGSFVSVEDIVCRMGPNSCEIIFYAVNSTGGQIVGCDWGKTHTWFAETSLISNEYGQNTIGKVIPKNVDYNSVFVTLHAIDYQGNVYTVVKHRCLDEIKDKTQQEFLVDAGVELDSPIPSEPGWFSYSVRWHCFLFDKPRTRIRLG